MGAKNVYLSPFNTEKIENSTNFNYLMTKKYHKNSNCIIINLGPDLSLLYISID